MRRCPDEVRCHQAARVGRPPYLRHHGNLVLSGSEMVRWLERRPRLSGQVLRRIRRHRGALRDPASEE